jgi:hypothetical protein
MHVLLQFNRRLFAAVVVSLLTLPAGAGVPAKSEPKTATPLKPALKAGDEVASFYSRAVTGPLMNKSICYVCRNGRRPVVMVLMRRIDPELKPLMKRIDTIVDKNRAKGVRGFGVLIGEDSVKATSAVQTFAFNNKLSLPLTVGSEAAAAGIGKLSADAAVTVVLYRKLKVVQSWSYRAGELKPANVKDVVKRIERFAAGK